MKALPDKSAPATNAGPQGRSWLEDRLLLILAAVGVLFAAFLVLLPFLDRSERSLDLKIGIINLTRAYKDYTSNGALTNHSHVWLSSNTVTIGNTRYPCLLEVRESRFNGQGTLAMTTNEVFIWLDANGTAKIIPPRYQPPLFGGY